MSRFLSYLEVAKQVIATYKGEVPLPNHLKGFFSGKKKFGSTDRRTIASLCFNYFRAGLALEGSLDEKIIKSFFLCNKISHPFLLAIDKNLDEKVSIGLSEKVKLLGISPEDVFPFKEFLSPDIDREAFCLSMLEQPGLFIRARPGKILQAEQKLKAAGITCSRIEEDVLAFENGVKLDDVININRDAVVQDLSSQHTLDFLDLAKFKDHPVDVWDCCAASGGKSILVYDRLKGRIRLSVTDIRPAVLKNLTQRLAEAGVPIYHSQVTDLSKPVSGVGKFPLIICDAPCTGSGTWSRVPEQLHYFKKEKINYYTRLQRQIITHSISHLENGGYYTYITCSVFAEENEKQVEHILQQQGIELVQMNYIKGYTHSADTLFTSTFKLSL